MSPSSGPGNLERRALRLEELRAEVRSCKHFIAPSICTLVPTSSTALTEAVTVTWLDADDTNILHPVQVCQKKK
jgi:hypothetical protein